MAALITSALSSASSRESPLQLSSRAFILIIAYQRSGIDFYFGKVA